MKYFLPLLFICVMQSAVIALEPDQIVGEWDYKGTMQLEEMLMRVNGIVAFEKNGTYKDYASVIAFENKKRMFFLDGPSEGIWTIEKGQLKLVTTKDSIDTFHSNVALITREFYESLPNDEADFMIPITISKSKIVFKEASIKSKLTYRKVGSYKETPQQIVENYIQSYRDKYRHGLVNRMSPVFLKDYKHYYINTVRSYEKKKLAAILPVYGVDSIEKLEEMNGRTILTKFLKHPYSIPYWSTFDSNDLRVKVKTMTQNDDAATVKSVMWNEKSAKIKNETIYILKRLDGHWKIESFRKYRLADQHLKSQKTEDK